MSEVIYILRRAKVAPNGVVEFSKGKQRALDM